LTGDGPGAELDLAIIGGGVAGTSVAWAAQQARPDWAIALFERTDRIGGRLHSVHIDGLDHPIELGGMRYITSHRRVASLVERFSLPTHAFDPTGGPERSVLRGVVANGADDPDAGRAYDLNPDLVGRTAHQLMDEAFDRIVPGFAGLDHEGYVARRATARYLDRRLTDWPIGEALETVLGGEGRQFVTDIFGYDPGIRPFNAPDLIEFLSDGGDPSDQARTPDDGMDRIPQALADAFGTEGGAIHLNRELASVAVVDGAADLRFAEGDSARAKRVVLATPLPALQLVASRSPALQRSTYQRVFDAVEGFPAMKLYLWFDQPWWRPTVRGPRTTTDLPARKVHYFDGREGSRSALLAMFADGLDVRPWAQMFAGAPPGSPAPPAMLAAVLEGLHEIHPEVSDIPQPVGSALMYWGADPHEVAWHLWRAGFVSDEILRIAPQPDESQPIYIANEAFSRHQTWVEGALEGADAVVERLTA